MPKTSLTLSFDIGYASIGWCVLDSTSPAPAAPGILGTGVVTFPTDDCLASKRRDLRRTRRHIRSTRQRIERMKLWLTKRDVLSRAELDKPGHPAPFLLAAAALQGHKTLSAWELWTVLRWYAHNRGYDGNSLWARDEANDDDTEKETNAKSIMAKHGTSTMAETVCACLELNPADHNTRISSALPYKTLNAAYPREIVFKEVSDLLSKHIGKIPNLNSEAVRFLLKTEALTKPEREKLTTAGIRLPLRYHGGLLFGQLVPRFDNRIISRCPITWATEYDKALDEGKDESQARKSAEKFAKVPAAKSKEFLEYRFARILANLRANGEPIHPELRHTFLDLARKQGRLTAKDLTREIKEYYGKAKTNVRDYFKLHPDSAEALVLDPVADEVRKASESRAKLSPIWPLLTEETKNHVTATWQKSKSISLAEIIHINGDRETLEAALEPAFAKANKPKQGKIKYADLGQYLKKTTVVPKIPSGRAPYARPVLKQVLAEVMEGFDSTRPSKSQNHPDGENKESDGILYQLSDPESRARTLQSERPLDSLTNNHLVRHRLLIMERLADDISAEFVTPDHEVTQIIVEVARELKEFSGKTAKEISSELNSRLKDFKSTVAYLGKHAPDLEINGSLIRKARIAMDMEWKCPFTGDKYDAYNLRELEREHIIPYATRNTNALHALVLTWREVNQMKGKRSALQFIEENAGDQVPGRENLSIANRTTYEKFVDKLKVTGHDDDRRRQKARKALLMTAQMDEKDLGFTDGKLTQTSHLMKLAMRGLTTRFPNAIIDPIPGAVTAEIRKAWRLIGTLSQVCPEVIVTDENGEEKIRPKDEIRSLTHMHHALDAATIGLTAHYFPLRKRGQDQKGKLWRALLKRNRNAEEQKLLHGTGLFHAYQKASHDNQGTPTSTKTELRLTDLPKGLKQSLRLSLAEARVMQHLPADRSGAKAELTTWGVVSTEGEGDDARIALQQSTFIDTTGKIQLHPDGSRKRKTKTREERAGKLLGPQPKGGSGKLAAIKGAMIIGENYGLALDPTPTVIPFHNVPTRLADLHKANGGKPVRILRNGMLVKIAKWPGKNGVWRIQSCQASLKVDFAKPQETERSWREVSIHSLMKRGLEILPQKYTGHALKD